MVTCSGFHGSITWSNVRLRMFSWPICSEPVVSLGIEQNQCSAQCNSIGVDIVLQKGSTPAAYNREIYSVTWSSYQRWLSTQICAQNGFCCNAFCSDSTCTHPLCSSSLHVGLFWEGLQLLCLAAFFLEQVQNLIQFSSCCLFSTSTFLPWAGSCCICWLTCSFIKHGCQHKFGHRMNSAAMLSVVNRLVPIHFVAVFFMLVCFVRVCSRFILLHCS